MDTTTTVLYYICNCDPRPFPVLVSELAEAEGVIECDNCSRLCTLKAVLIPVAGNSEQFYVEGIRHGQGRSIEFEVEQPFVDEDNLIVTFRNGYDVASLSVLDLALEHPKPPFLWNTGRDIYEFILPARTAGRK